MGHRALELALNRLEAKHSKKKAVVVAPEDVGGVTGYKVYRAWETVEGGYVLAVAPKLHTLKCIYCGSEDLNDDGGEITTFVHTPIGSIPRKILVVRQSHVCKCCGRTYSDSLPDLCPSGRMSIEAAQYLLKHVKRPMADIAGELSVTPKTLTNYLVEIAAAVKNMHNRQLPLIFGIDDKVLASKRRFVITNLLNNTFWGCTR